jgi:deoxyribonuclease V
MTALEIMRWLSPGTPAEGRAMQEALRVRVRIGKPLGKRPRTVCGLDAAYEGRHVHAAACLMDLETLEEMEAVTVARLISFPYVPGLLTFREGPALAEAVRGLGARPDVLLFDGQGIAHPMGLGIAAHMGLLLGIPSVGCAKSRLVGSHREPAAAKGALSPLRMPGGKEAGVVLRTRTGVRPLYVSPGHLIDINGAVDIVMRCIGGHRLPEPIRRAHRLAGEARGLMH